MKKTYWIRWVYADQDRKADDSRTFSTLTACKRWAWKLDKSEISFYYVMTLDPWGECFVECHNVRRPA